MSTPPDWGWELAAGKWSHCLPIFSSPLPSHLCIGNDCGVSQDCACRVTDRYPGMGSEAVRRTKEARNMIPLTLEQTVQV